jgi:hypothetical protein
MCNGEFFLKGESLYFYLGWCYPKTMKVLLLSRYSRLGSTSRVRAFQYIPYLESKGISISQAPLFKDDYIKKLYDRVKIQVRTICSAYLRRVFTLLKACSYDLLWIEKELLPWLPEWAEMLLFSMGIPYIVDYDDAIFHRYDMHTNKLVRRLFGRKIDRIMSHAALVIVGNDYLAMRALRAGAKRVEKLPSVVDLEKYEPLLRNYQGSSI